MDVKQKRELRNMINTLKKIRGRHTELVSVYIPAGYNITKIINHLSEEQHTATNIKDKRTRQNVQDSLERIIRKLKLYKKTPENGVAFFAGNTSDKEGQANIEVFSINPPTPLNIRIYRCDQSFVVDILEDMMDDIQV
ncbi:peptide chain release factor 1, partial [Candidatus Woesearchaeota archaeon]|nr:peptide chain release factor 1 [Candidatus Woesearchaeota archaeon]